MKGEAFFFRYFSSAILQPAALNVKYLLLHLFVMIIIFTSSFQYQDSIPVQNAWSILPVYCTQSDITKDNIL